MSLLSSSARLWLLGSLPIVPRQRRSQCPPFLSFGGRRAFSGSSPGSFQWLRGTIPKLCPSSGRRRNLDSAASNYFFSFCLLSTSFSLRFRTSSPYVDVSGGKLGSRMECPSGDGARSAAGALAQERRRGPILLQNNRLTFFDACASLILFLGRQTFLAVKRYNDPLHKKLVALTF